MRLTTALYAALCLPLLIYLLWHNFYLVASLFAKRQKTFAKSIKSQGKVAILYTVCDDFQTNACASLLKQESVSFKVFILDDSTREEERLHVDIWVRDKPIQVIRRSNRNGNKAGNINNWLNQYKTDKSFTHVLIVDADCILPNDFCRQLLEKAQEGDYAFAQGCHTGDAELSTLFQRMLHQQVECIWLYQLPASNIISMPYILGHGVLINIADLSEVGGFPYLVSEDLALTIVLAERGRRGIIAPSVIAKEGFPPNYYRFWRRRQRWISADAELIHNMFTNLSRNRLGMLPKLDLWLRELKLGLGSAYWFLLMAMACFALIGIESGVVLSAIFWIPFLILSLSPFAPPLINGKHSFLRAITFLSFTPFIGIASSALNPVCTWRGINGNLAFIPTGSSCGSKQSDKFITYWEYLSGSLIIAGGVLSANLILAAAGLAICMSPMMRGSHENVSLVSGGIVFSGFVLGQVGYDIYLGHVPIEHMLALMGLSTNSV